MRSQHRWLLRHGSMRRATDPIVVCGSADTQGIGVVYAALDRVAAARVARDRRASLPCDGSPPSLLVL
jgi:hypothetical protein